MMQVAKKFDERTMVFFHNISGTCSMLATFAEYAFASRCSHAHSRRLPILCREDASSG